MPDNEWNGSIEETINNIIQASLCVGRGCVVQPLLRVKPSRDSRMNMMTVSPNSLQNFFYYAQTSKTHFHGKRSPRKVFPSSCGNSHISAQPTGGKLSIICDGSIRLHSLRNNVCGRRRKTIFMCRCRFKISINFSVRTAMMMTITRVKLERAAILTL